MRHCSGDIMWLAGTMQLPPSELLCDRDEIILHNADGAFEASGVNGQVVRIKSRPRRWWLQAVIELDRQRKTDSPSDA
jgi:hypothetical protein